MSSMTFSQKKFLPSAPEKGSFPLDHEGQCKKSFVKYMICLRENGEVNSFCRDEAKDYLSCRMSNNLMAKEEWSKLGFNDNEAEKTKPGTSPSPSNPPSQQ